MSQNISIVQFHVVFQTVLFFTNKEFSDRADTTTAWELQSLKWNLCRYPSLFLVEFEILSLFQRNVFSKNNGVKLNGQVRKETYFTDKSFTVFDVLQML